MTSETIVAAFDTAAHAQDAVNALKSAGIPASDISQHAGNTATTTNGTTQPMGASSREQPGFWASLFGTGDDASMQNDIHARDHGVYDHTVREGGAVVSVKVTDMEHNGDRVMDILEHHHPLDIDERAAAYGLQTPPATHDTGRMASGTMASGTDETLQLAEEQLEVGTRTVNCGTTRIRRYVVETPVEETVSLRHESVSVERRPVTGGATVGADAFKDRTIEVTEMDEEAVVAKTARITEEVVVKRDVGERTETVHGTVRKEKIDIEKSDDGVTRGPATAPEGARPVTAPVGARPVDR